MKSGKELAAIFLKQVVTRWPPDFNPVSCPDRRLFVEFLDVGGGNKIGQELATGSAHQACVRNLGLGKHIAQGHRAMLAGPLVEIQRPALNALPWGRLPSQGRTPSLKLLRKNSLCQFLALQSKEGKDWLDLSCLSFLQDVHRRGIFFAQRRGHKTRECELSGLAIAPGIIDDCD